jgi:hypothetical protein
MGKGQPFSALLIQVLAELGAGNCWEGHITCPGEIVGGVCDGKDITVDVSYERVDSAIHEAIHRLRPTWKEQGVKRTTTRLMRVLTQEQIHIIDREWQRRARKRRSVLALEA